MKNTIYLYALVALFAIACSSTSTETSEETASETTVSGNYGDTEWSSEDAITLSALMDTLQQTDSIYTTVKGTIDAACQAKGCWLSMKEAESEVFVKFKDYGFFVPMNSAGHDASMKGWAYVETQSVADQLEYAKDAEASQDEIEAITEPVRKYTFTAEGVVID